VEERKAFGLGRCQKGIENQPICVNYKQFDGKEKKNIHLGQMSDVIRFKQSLEKELSKMGVKQLF